MYSLIRVSDCVSLQRTCHCCLCIRACFCYKGSQLLHQALLLFCPPPHPMFEITIEITSLVCYTLSYVVHNMPHLRFFFPYLKMKVPGQLSRCSDQATGRIMQKWGKRFLTSSQHPRPAAVPPTRSLVQWVLRVPFLDLKRPEREAECRNEECVKMYIQSCIRIHGRVLV